MTKKIIFSDLSWMNDAKCKNKSDLFFGPTKEGRLQKSAREARAIAICATCPVIYKCRLLGRENGELGIWGGETEDERYAAGYLKNDDVARRNRERNRRLARKMSNS
jgi:WhiB family redox-sensing transcriptional regulator